MKKHSYKKENSILSETTYKDYIYLTSLIRIKEQANFIYDNKIRMKVVSVEEWIDKWVLATY